MAVKSNLSVAGNASASFNKSANALNSIHLASSGGARTNTLGVGKVPSALTSYGTGFKTLATSVVSAGNNIHSVAKDFEQIDLQASNEFQKNMTSPMARWLP